VNLFSVKCMKRENAMKRIEIKCSELKQLTALTKPVQAACSDVKIVPFQLLLYSEGIIAQGFDIAAKIPSDLLYYDKCIQIPFGEWCSIIDLLPDNPETSTLTIEDSKIVLECNGINCSLTVSEAEVPLMWQNDDDPLRTFDVPEDAFTKLLSKGIEIAAKALCAPFDLLNFTRTAIQATDGFRVWKVDFGLEIDNLFLRAKSTQALTKYSINKIILYNSDLVSFLAQDNIEIKLLRVSADVGAKEFDKLTNVWSSFASVHLYKVSEIPDLISRLKRASAFCSKDVQPFTQLQKSGNECIVARSAPIASFKELFSAGCLKELPDFSIDFDSELLLAGISQESSIGFVGNPGNFTAIIVVTELDKYKEVYALALAVESNA
jgi:hypothetical protein